MVRMEAGIRLWKLAWGGAGEAWLGDAESGEHQPAEHCWRHIHGHTRLHSAPRDHVLLRARPQDRSCEWGGEELLCDGERGTVPRESVEFGCSGGYI